MLPNVLSCTALMIALSLANLTYAHSNHYSGHHDEQVELTMKKMQRAYRTALQSETLEELKPAVSQLIEVTRQASTLHYGINATESTDYQHGMRELRADLERLRKAVAADDLVLAKQILETHIKATQRRSHENFDVDEDKYQD